MQTNPLPEEEEAQTDPKSSSSALDDVARVMEARLGLQPGRNCIVGEGLASVDLGLFLDEKKARGSECIGSLQISRSTLQVSLEIEPAAAESLAASSARLFAEAKTRRRVLQSFGWSVATLSEAEWSAAGEDDHKKVHLIVSCVNKALGHGEDGHHHHSSGCGCNH